MFQAKFKYYLIKTKVYIYIYIYIYILRTFKGSSHIHRNRDNKISLKRSRKSLSVKPQTEKGSVNFCCQFIRVLNKHNEVFPCLTIVSKNGKAGSTEDTEESKSFPVETKTPSVYWLFLTESTQASEINFQLRSLRSYCCRHRKKARWVFS